MHTTLDLFGDDLGAKLMARRARNATAVQMIWPTKEMAANHYAGEIRQMRGPLAKRNAFSPMFCPYAPIFCRC